MLMDCALCWAEPCMNFEGPGPLAKPPVMGCAAGAWNGSRLSVSKPATGGCHELLLFYSLRQAEPSNACGLCPMPGGSVDASG